MLNQDSCLRIPAECLRQPAAVLIKDGYDSCFDRATGCDVRGQLRHARFVPMLDRSIGRSILICKSLRCAECLDDMEEARAGRKLRTIERIDSAGCYQPIVSCGQYLARSGE
jgi:hypothetical protein